MTRLGLRDRIKFRHHFQAVVHQEKGRGEARTKPRRVFSSKWWWSSGQRSCLEPQQSEFESRWLLKLSVQKDENKRKRSRGWPVLKKSSKAVNQLTSSFPLRPMCRKNFEPELFKRGHKNKQIRFSFFCHKSEFSESRRCSFVDAEIKMSNPGDHPAPALSPS